jgi:hypothetical protein
MRLNSRSKRLTPRKIQIDSNGPNWTSVLAAASVAFEFEAAIALVGTLPIAYR